MVMSVAEVPVVFGCGDDQMVGVATPAATPSTTGVLILVGGRQYRAGSHRQFVLLARRLAGAGHCAFRFDFRGMGDSTGGQRSFEAVSEDIAAAIAALQAACPAVRRVVLWGLCDAATAAVLYWQQSHDARIAGLCLVNPWLRSEVGLARTRVRHYYRERLRDPVFWRNLLRGQVGPLRALRDYLGAVRTARRGGGEAGFQRAVFDGITDFPGPLLLLLSERDLTAQEFLDRVLDDPSMAPVLLQQRVRRVAIAAADHTFSRQCWRREAEDAVVSWLADQTLQ